MMPGLIAGIIPGLNRYDTRLTPAFQPAFHLSLYLKTFDLPFTLRPLFSLSHLDIPQGQPAPVGSWMNGDCQASVMFPSSFLTPPAICQHFVGSSYTTGRFFPPSLKQFFLRQWSHLSTECDIPRNRSLCPDQETILNYK